MSLVLRPWLPMGHLRLPEKIKVQNEGWTLGTGHGTSSCEVLLNDLREKWDLGLRGPHVQGLVLRVVPLERMVGLWEVLGHWRGRACPYPGFGDSGSSFLSFASWIWGELSGFTTCSCHSVFIFPQAREERGQPVTYL